MKTFDIKLLKPIKLKTKKKLFNNNAIDFFRNQKKVTAALLQALLDGDKEAFHEIFSGYLSVVNKEELSRRSKVPIATIRRMAAGSNFNVDNLLKVTSVLRKELVA